MKKFWYGKEIEGRLYNLDSIYIGHDFDTFENECNDFHHYLIGTSLIDEMDKGGTDITWNYLEELIDMKRKMVTIEARPEQIKKIPHSMKLKCHILLWIDIPELSELKSSDSVKLCIQNHDMYVYTLFNGQRVTRNDYIHDRYEK